MPERVQAAGALAAAEAAVTQVVEGYGSVGVQVTISADWDGTLTFEASINGSTWVAVALTPAGGGAATTSTTAAGLWRAIIAGFKAVRTRVSTYTDGTATVQMSGSPA